MYIVAGTQIETALFILILIDLVYSQSQMVAHLIVAHIYQITTAASLATVSTIAVVVLLAVLIAALKKQARAYAFFTHSKVVYIGLISYSLYLWHWGVLSISRWTIGIHWWSVPFQVALMLGLSVASYRWIETPLRKGNWFEKRWMTLVVGGGTLVHMNGSSDYVELYGYLTTGQQIQAQAAWTYFQGHMVRSA